MAASVAALSVGSPFWAGVLLAMALVKPQLSYLLIAFLIIWVAGDWRVRKQFVIGFGAMVGLLLVGSELDISGLVQFLEGSGSRSTSDSIEGRCLPKLSEPGLHRWWLVV